MAWRFYPITVSICICFVHNRIVLFSHRAWPAGWGNAFSALFQFPPSLSLSMPPYPNRAPNKLNQLLWHCFGMDLNQFGQHIWSVLHVSANQTLLHFHFSNNGTSFLVVGRGRTCYLISGELSCVAVAAYFHCLSSFSLFPSDSFYA